MRNANSSLFGFVCAPLGVASFQLRTMRDANSSLNSSVGAPLLAATCRLRAVCDTNSSLNSSVGTPVVAALFHLRTVRDANSSLNIIVGAPLVATLFPVRDTNSSLNCLFRASAALATFTHRLLNKRTFDILSELLLVYCFSNAKTHVIVQSARPPSEIPVDFCDEEKIVFRCGEFQLSPS
jgi:hypothetical protein